MAKYGWSRSGNPPGEFAETLSNYVDLTVVDKTSLTGKYDCSIVWAGRDGITIFEAVKKQLGLKLEPQKSPVGVLVVDRANRLPTEN